MRRIMVLGNAHRTGVQEEADRLLPILEQFATIVLVDLFQKQDLEGIDVELVLVLGGDGAILRAARQMGYRQFPVVGINLGRLGFLADLGTEDLVQHFQSICCGAYRVTEHLMFEASISLGGEVTGNPYLGLNEISIHTAPPFHMVELELIVNGEMAARYSGDGLIVSTPVGSTAYSLSAGGPILGQELSAFVITPICAHGLTNRPLVDAADKTYTVAVRRSTNAILVIDGQEQIAMPVGATVTIRQAPVKFKLARIAGRSFYHTLHDKLFWGRQPEYRKEAPSTP